MVQLYDIVIVTGYTNLVLFVLILLTCRCIGTWPLVKKLMDNDWFTDNVYTYHCAIWYAFILSTAIHVIANLML